MFFLKKKLFVAGFELNDLVSFFAEAPMIVFMSVIGGLAIVGSFIGNQMLVILQNPEAARRINFLNAVSVDRLQSLVGLLFAALSGILGSGTILLAKISVQLLSTSLDGDNQFVYIGTYIIIGLLVALAILQVIYLNKGLAIAPSTLVVPMFFCVWTLFAMVKEALSL